MPAHRMNMRMIKDVLRLKFDGGFSHDRITNRPCGEHFQVPRTGDVTVRLVRSVSLEQPIGVPQSRARKNERPSSLRKTAHFTNCGKSGARAIRTSGL